MPGYRALTDALRTERCPFAHGPWREEERPRPPYVVVEPDTSTAYGADNVAWLSQMRYDVMLFTCERDIGLERAYECALADAGFFATKIVTFENDDGLWQCVWSVSCTD